MRKRNHRLVLQMALLFLVLTSVSFKTSMRKENPDLCLSKEEQRMYMLIMNYRKLKKLPAIKWSASLTKVAQTHAYDLSVNKPSDGDKCNFHSWSAQGNWTSCCYDPKHSQAACMWSKPKEIAGFNTDGFEIAYGSLDTQFVATPDAALAGWKKHPGHHNVIINKDIWKDRTWKSIGIGVYKNFICVWFASTEDKVTVIQSCN
ncbi:MAG: S-layer protein [Chitinophagaceae bacterium]|nr:S-layer protein [Chitinophagaceae bacterium]